MISKDERDKLIESVWRETFPKKPRSHGANIQAGEFLPPRYHFGEVSGQPGMNREALTEQTTTARKFTTDGPIGHGSKDTLFFFFDQTRVADMDLSELDPNFPVVIDLPHGNLTAAVPDDSVARVDAWFVVIREFEQLSSEVLPLEVDFAPPGGIPDRTGTPPGGFPPSWRDRENATLAAIPELAGPVIPGTTILNVPEWENMTAGDKVTVHWGTRTFSATLRDGDEGLPLRIRLPADLPATPFPNTVRYDITDRFGNFSGTSREQLDGGGVVPPRYDATLDFEQADDQTVAPPSGFIDLWPNEIPKAQWVPANRLMQVTFDNTGFTHNRAVKIDVHHSEMYKPGQYGGKLLTVGDPQFKSLQVRAFLTLSQTWTSVSFYLTSVDDDMEVHFQGADGQTLHKAFIDGGDVTIGHLVTYTAAAPLIKRISIRCREVVRLDNFRFKGHAR